MTALRPRGSVVPPGLTAAEQARAERFKVVYQVGAIFGIDCSRDAEKLADRLLFMKFLREKGEVPS